MLSLFQSFLLALFVVVMSAGSLRAGEHGEFVGELKYKPIGNGEHEVLEDFGFDAPDGSKWGVPAMSVTDGASIPRVLWTIVGSPFTGDYIKAAVLHDHFCKMQSRPWKDVHRMFYHAMLANGESETRAKLMYLAVYYRGPRWSEETTLKKISTCMVLNAPNREPSRVCRVTYERVKTPIEFPEPSKNADLSKAPTATEIDSLWASKDNASKLGELNIEQLEAKADKARQELEALRK